MLTRKFLSARWEYLAMYNFEVDPSLLEKHLPPFTEIDLFEGKALVSVVGFMFNDTKVRGIKWPGFVSFEEVNLRYYIKHFDGKAWKRGVGFISEIVPTHMVASLANYFYNEHYSTAQMKHKVIVEDDKLCVAYHWRKKSEEWNHMSLKALPVLEEIKENSEAEFILEHYFGYNELNEHTTIEYAVEHPRWRIYPVVSHELRCNFEQLYGKEFAAFLKDKEPTSVFLAKGSKVKVNMPLKIRQGSSILHR